MPIIFKGKKRSSRLKYFLTPLVDSYNVMSHLQDRLKGLS